MYTSDFLIVGGSIAAQTPKIEKPFRKILPEFQQIIEIGFHRGALSLWLHENKTPETKLICYDITFSFKEITNKDIDFRLGNCFDDNIITEIKNLIQSPLRTLVLCDGGSKEAEFELYSTFLKKNDVIMCHDFAESPEDFEKVKNNLNWEYPPESHLANISKSVFKNQLAEYDYIDFKNVLWGSFIKT